MFILITYDVSTVSASGRRRLRKTAIACKDYGVRVQNSVFEVKVETKDWLVLRARLLGIIEPELDSLRFYFLDKDIEVEHHGTKKTRDFEEPLIV
jgi:CRISPR-associated protein Cas2